MQRVLITGASGYIGQHLALFLLDAGFKVRGFSRGVKPAGLSAVEWQQGDVCTLSDVQQAVHGCDAVVHLACLPLGPSWQDPVGDFRVNALGTLHVLQASLEAGVHRVVYTSTAQVYGYANNLPTPEGEPTQPDSPYAAHKLCGEILCTTFTRCYGIDTVILRLTNVYGAPVDGSSRPTVEAIFVQRVAQGLPPIIKGSPAEGRDFIHVRDVVRALHLALVVVGEGTVINIGTGIMTTLPDLARLVIDISGKVVQPVLEKTDARPLRIQAEVRRARHILGFQAEVALSTGLAEFFQL